MAQNTLGDVEGFGAVKHGSSEYTAVRLRNYESLLSGISPEQSEAMMRWLPAARVAVHGLASLASASGDYESADDLSGVGIDMRQVRNLEDALRLSRNKYGGEILLP